MARFLNVILLVSQLATSVRLIKRRDQQQRDQTALIAESQEENTLNLAKHSQQDGASGLADKTAADQEAGAIWFADKTTMAQAAKNDNAVKQPASEFSSGFDQVTGSDVSSPGWQNVMDAVNTQRRNNGKNELCYDSRLGQASSDYAGRMGLRDSVSHGMSACRDCKGSSTPTSRAEDKGFRGDVSEVLTSKTPSMKATDASWHNRTATDDGMDIILAYFNSASHKAGLLNGAMECMGYGEYLEPNDKGSRIESWNFESYHCIKLGAGGCKC